MTVYDDGSVTYDDALITYDGDGVLGEVEGPLPGFTIEQPSYIEGISWEITPGRWVLTWNLSSTLPQVGQWELGTVGLSELGVTTSLVNTIA